MGESMYAMTRSVPKSFAAFLISSATTTIAKQIYWVRWFRMYDVGDQRNPESYSSENAIADRLRGAFDSRFRNMWRPGGFPKVNILHHEGFMITIIMDNRTMSDREL